MNASRAIVIALFSAWSAHAQSGGCAAADQSAGEPQFFDEPHFTVAGVTDNTYRGGHGADTVLRSTEALTKAAATLPSPSPGGVSEDLHHAQGEVNERSGRPLDAVREFERAAKADPSESNIFDWGTELLAHLAPRAAAEVFTRGTHLFPRSTRMLLGLATAEYALGSYEQAARFFFEASDLNPTDPNPYLFLAKVHAREITESEGYRQRLARFTKLQPENPLANYYYALAIWNGRSGPEDVDTSRLTRALLQKTIQQDPRFGPAYLQLGVLDMAERKYSDAIRAYRTAIDVNPGLEEAHYRLSEAYRLTGDRGNAARELDTYNQLSKRSSEQLEQQRRETRQFIIALCAQHGPPSVPQSK